MKNLKLSKLSSNMNEENYLAGLRRKREKKNSDDHIRLKKKHILFLLGNTTTQKIQ